VVQIEAQCDDPHCCQHLQRGYGDSQIPPRLDEPLLMRSVTMHCLGASHPEQILRGQQLLDASCCRQKTVVAVFEGLESLQSSSFSLCYFCSNVKSRKRIIQNRPTTARRAKKKASNRSTTSRKQNSGQVASHSPNYCREKHPRHPRF
jgi:hypothetical protein